MPTLPTPTYRHYQGDIRTLAGQLEAVDCVMCSPPYFRQRVYGATPALEVGQEPDTPCYRKLPRATTPPGAAQHPAARYRGWGD